MKNRIIILFFSLVFWGVMFGADLKKFEIPKDFTKEIRQLDKNLDIMRLSKKYRIKERCHFIK